MEIYSSMYVDFYVMQMPLADANAQSSTGQFARWLESSIISRNNGKFNVVIIGLPPYSDTPSFAPGYTALRWNFRRMGVHAVLSSSTAYERFVNNNVYYINVGTGCAVGIETTDKGISTPGILEISATPTIIAFDFYDNNGNIADRATIVS
jgi:hypothetical protein